MRGGIIIFIDGETEAQWDEVLEGATNQTLFF